jgi:hypothetical protein
MDVAIGRFDNLFEFHFLNTVTIYYVLTLNMTIHNYMLWIVTAAILMFLFESIRSMLYNLATRTDKSVFEQGISSYIDIVEDIFTAGGVLTTSLLSSLVAVLVKQFPQEIPSIAFCYILYLVYKRHTKQVATTTNIQKPVTTANIQQQQLGALLARIQTLEHRISLLT